MWYILSMNKDVIYIEPEDDITDIIAKIENAKEKIVALVPPKKAGVFRSIVNIKLIAKTSASSGKTAVIVTTDPSIIKLAATTRTPVTKNLQSAPVIPELDGEESVIPKKDDTPEEEPEDEESEDEEVEDEKSEDEAETEETKDAEEDGDKEDEDNEEEIASDSDDKKNKDSDSKKSKKSKDGKTPLFDRLAASNNPVAKWIGTHKKIAIGGSIALVVLIIVGIWAFVIAPAATLTIGLRTTTANFSENVTFTDVLTEEDASQGKFFIQERKIENKSEIEFDATGQKNVGVQAKGTLKVYTYIDEAGGSANVPANVAYTHDGLKYITASSASFAYDGKNTSVCENVNATIAEFKQYGCLMSGTIDVVAEAPGANYNIEVSNGDGWNSIAGVAVSRAEITGGTDQMITVVQQSDIDKAKEELAKQDSDSGNSGKEKLFESIEDDSFVIESSYKQTISDAVSTPAIGEEVKEGAKAKLAVTTIDSVFVVDKTKVEEFIASKAKLAENYKIYSMNDPFVENFVKVEGAGYTGKLKTSYTSGPKVTENDVVEMVKGKGLGVAQHDLKSIDGIGSIRIDVSYPWVTSIPNDPEKITVNLEVTEQ